MSTVNGFQVGSETLKYNYESLENYNTPEFSTTKTYAVGDYVIYQGKLYKCSTAVTTAGSWNSSNWTLAVLSDDVSDLSNALDALDDGCLSFKIIPNTYIAGNGVETFYTGWSSSDFVPVQGNKIIIISGVRSTYNSFYDANKDFIPGKNFTVESGSTIVTVPENAKYFRLSNTSSAMGEEYVYLNTTVRIVDLETDNINKKIEEQTNLYSGQILKAGRVYDGVYSESITTIHCTDYIPIIPGNIYAIYGGYISTNYSNYYDSNKVYKGSLPLEGLINTYPYDGLYNFLMFTALSDAAYTRVNYLTSDLVDGTDLRPEWYFRDVTNLVWAKKKLLVIGDSISTDVYGNYKKWVTDLQDEGFFSNGLVNNNSQHATGFVATYSSDTTTTFINRLIAVGDLTGFDAVITFGGINDWIQGVDFDAFKSAVDTYFAYLIEHATQARIIVFSPLHTSLYGTTNSAGNTQKDYDDYIKAVAKDYAFPCLNLTDESGFCPDKSATFSDMWTLLPAGFSDHDGVHPIETWEKNFLAPMIKGFLSGM